MNILSLSGLLACLAFPIGVLTPIKLAAEGPTTVTNPGVPTAEQGIRVAKFKMDREAAVSFTVDDGRADAATVGVPLFDRYGFHASFFLIVGGIPDNTPKSVVFSIPWTRWREIAESGHEIGNHTLNHRISQDSDEQAIKDIDEARQIIADKIGMAPVSFVYPEIVGMIACGNLSMLIMPSRESSKPFTEVITASISPSKKPTSS